MKPWLSEILEHGLVPYIISSDHLIESFDYSLFEDTHIIKRLEKKADLPFHNAYLLSNSLGFGNPNLKMPNWVYIDCVLMQTAVVGFAIAKDKAPDDLIKFYQESDDIVISKLDYIPISGQICSLGMNGNDITGYSLFSLKKYFPHLKHLPLANATKYAALCAYKADKDGKIVMGIAQYNNPALKIHASFGKKLYIEQPIIPLHPLKDMTLTYSMKVEFDDERIFNSQPFSNENVECDILMHYNDVAKKQYIQKAITQGKRFYIKDPIHIIKNGDIYLPICEE